MTTGFIILLIILAGLKVVLASPPTFVVEWMLSKFAMHPKLEEPATTVTFDGKHLEGHDKAQFIDQFNEAIYYDQYEELPSNDGKPLIIDTKKGKKDVRLFVYIYNDRIDVIKQYKQKTAAYSLLSDSLQERSMMMAKEIG
ncbi:YfmQ family protein [Metabacillus sp. 84]|uniref:YfmQ family protein n=1 Tax=unclassified Metabacillus TaxID=2675274 RepID=UPI003CF648BB